MLAEPHSVATAGTHLLREPATASVAPRRKLAALFIALLLATAAAATPLARIPLYPLPGYMLAFGTAMLVTNLILASLLLSRGAAEGDATTVHLGAVYLFVGVIFLPLTAAFPGAFGPAPLIGTTYSPIWLWTLWHGGFGAGIIGYAVSARRAAGLPGPATRRVVLAVVLVVVALALASTLGVEHLPPLFGNPATGMFSGVGQIPAWLLLAIDIVALWMTVRLPGQTSERLWLSVAMVAACFDVWLTFHAGARYSVGWYLGKVGSLTTTMVVLVSLVNDLSAIYRRVRLANTALADLASRDGLTGIANRRHFDAALSAETRRAARHGQSTALLMIDVDHFKRYNDLNGHQQGDDCLRQVASVVADNARRPGDVAARYGGEEFALVLPSTDVAGALRVGERILHDLRTLALAHGGSPNGRVTLSIGIAASGRADPLELVQRADAALYGAKKAGRDRIVCDGVAVTHAPAPESTGAAGEVAMQRDEVEGGVLEGR